MVRFIAQAAPPVMLRQGPVPPNEGVLQALFAWHGLTAGVEVLDLIVPLGVLAPRGERVGPPTTCNVL